ncbi:adenosine deaminase, partial [Enterococcus faecalis]
KKADFLLLNDIESFDINTVYKTGKVVFEKGEPFHYPEKIEEFPGAYLQTIQCKKLTEEDLLLKVATTKETGRCNVIQKQEIGT